MASICLRESIAITMVMVAMENMVDMVEQVMVQATDSMVTMATTVTTQIVTMEIRMIIL